jgi:hypothetical protein
MIDSYWFPSGTGKALLCDTNSMEHATAYGSRVKHGISYLAHELILIIMMPT